MRILIVIITSIWLVCSFVYAVYEPKMTSYTVVAAGLIAFLTAIANVKQSSKKENKSQSQSQNVSHNSIGIQVGNDFKIKEKE